jgi:hypothetical protein
MLRDYVTIDNQPHQKLSEKKKRSILSYLYAWEIQPGIHSCSIHQLKSKKGVLVNTPTITWAYTRTFKEKGKRRELG